MAKNNNKKKTKPAQQLDPLNSTQKIKKGLTLQKEGKLAFIKDVTQREVTNDPKYQDVMRNHKVAEETYIPASQEEVDELNFELTAKISELTNKIKKAFEDSHNNFNHTHTWIIDLEKKYDNLKFKFYVFVGLTTGIFIVSNLYNWIN